MEMAKQVGSVDNSRDRIPRVYLALALGIPLAHILLRATPLGSNFIYVMLGMPGLALLLVGTAVWGLFLLARFLMRQEWSRAVISGIPPVAVIVAVMTFPQFLYACNTAGDVLHFFVARPYYDRAVASLPSTRPRLAVFNWGGMAWASGGLVYDESDEVALPAGRQSAAWKAKAANTELGCGYGIQSLWSHYYLASFAC